MEVLWKHGEGSVRDVIERLGRPLAYTTVMTTLDRLYKKGLLRRRKHERAFYYAPRVARHEWARQLLSQLIAGFRGSPEMVASCLVDAAAHDRRVLDELEKKINQKRRELEEPR